MKKKLKLNSEECFRNIINYMLREFDADFDYVQKNPVIKGVDWYQYFWDTVESKKEFNDWLKQYLTKEVKLTPFQKSRVDTIVSLINLMYGLTVYNENNNIME